jgi:hypothetical protein
VKKLERESVLEKASLENTVQDGVSCILENAVWDGLLAIHTRDSLVANLDTMTHAETAHPKNPRAELD